MALAPKMENCHNIFSHIVDYEHRCILDNFIFYGLILVELHQLPFLMTQIQCFADHKIVEK